MFDVAMDYDKFRRTSGGCGSDWGSDSDRFIVLCIYAWDTRTIAKATSMQSKNAVVPVLSLGSFGLNQDRPDLQVWQLENHGLGPALNIDHFFRDSKVMRRPSIMQGKTAALADFNSPLGVEIHEILKTGEGFRVEYESAFGEKFRSRFWLEGPLSVSIKFERVLGEEK